jgi:hypothetical protein
MSDVNVTRGTFGMTVPVPDDLVSIPADGEWAAWLGVAKGRREVILVSIAVTAYNPKTETLAAIVRGRYPDAALVEEFTTTGGQAVGFRRKVTQPVDGRDVTTGQAQALVVYPGPGALGVVSGLCLDPDDLDRAAVIVTGIAAGMTVTSASAAALPGGHAVLAQVGHEGLVCFPAVGELHRHAEVHRLGGR